MIWLVVAVLLALGMWAYGRVRFASDRRPVSRAWQLDDARRGYRHGVDQAKVQRWPIEKS
jgi:hypothetical protein